MPEYGGSVAHNARDGPLGRAERASSHWAKRVREYVGRGAQLRTRTGCGQRANRGPQAGLRARMKVKVYEFVLFFFRSVFEVLCKDSISNYAKIQSLFNFEPTG
jgi:hypothetical protein